jgi:hypothetical protein
LHTPYPPGSHGNPFAPGTNSGQVHFNPHAAPPAHNPFQPQDPHFQGPRVQPFSPSIHRTVQHQATTPFHTPARNLFSPNHSYGRPSPMSHTSSASQHTSRRINYEDSCIDTEESRAAASMEFLQICLILTHMSPNVSLYDPVNHCHVDPSFNLFPREPCPHARRKVLNNLDSSRRNRNRSIIPAKTI